MLQQIRQASNSGGTYILVGILIVVFAVFFGAPLDSCGTSQGRKLVAKVAGTEIHTDDVNAIYNRVFSRQSKTADEAQILQQQATSLKAIILIQLLADRGTAAGLRVSDEELQAYIKDPLRNFEFGFAYGNSGQFDGPFYKAYVQNQLRMNVQKYQEFKRTELLARKYLRTVEMQFQPIPAEVKALYTLRNTMVDLEFVRLDPTKIKEFVPVDDEAVAAYLTSNAADVQKYYDAHKAEDYSTSEEVLLRRIFILKPVKEDGDDKVKAATEKWAKVQERAKSEDFAALAGEVTEDFAKEKQGLMDWTSLQNVDQNIAAKVKDAKKGDVVEVETDFAYMLVKLEDRKAAKITPLAEVSSDIARQLLQDSKVDSEITRLVAEIRSAAASAPTLKDAVDKLKGVAPAPAEGEEAAEAPATIWDAVSVAQTGEFSQEGQDFAAMFGGQFPGLAGRRQPWDAVPSIGKSPEVALAAFALTAEKPIAEPTFKVGGSSFIVRLAKKVEANEEGFAEAQDKIAEELRRGKTTALLGNWESLFIVPNDNYGPWFDALLNQSIDAKEIRFYEKNYGAIRLITEEDKTPVTIDLKPPVSKG